MRTQTKSAFEEKLTLCEDYLNGRAGKAEIVNWLNLGKCGQQL